MLRISTRRLLAGLAATAVCTVATIVAGVAPAQAAASGYILTRGTGSLYSSNDIVNQGGIPGGSARTFSYKLANTGSTSQQFKVTTTLYGTGVSSTLLLGSTVLPAPYYTAPIAPGKTLVLTLKVQVAGGVPQGEYQAYLTMRDPETNGILDSAVADVNATYQTGNTNHDLFLKTGTQPFVGGSVGQFETANAIKAGSTATFVLRLQNNSGTPGAITLSDVPNFSCPSSFAVVVKQGSTNVTAAVEAGTYSTGILAPGAKKELKVTVKLLTATSCTGAYYGYTASGSGTPISQYAHVIIAA
jgi:hypothetical protein